MTPPPRSRLAGDAIMVGTSMLMGSSYPFAKSVLTVMSPLLYSGSRYLVASLFLFAVLALRRQPIALPRRDWVPMILLALVGVVWQLALLNQASADVYFAQTLQNWEQGRFIRFHGLIQWLGWLWPFALLGHLVRSLSRPQA